MISTARSSGREMFVCAFRGRRDSYQVPLALAEAGQLDLFITDLYAMPSLSRLLPYLSPGLREKIEFRRMKGIPSSSVQCLWGTTFIEHARHRLGLPSAITYMKLDKRFSLAAARRAFKNKSSLLLYSPYAWEAFVHHYHHDPKRILFQYHPHTDMEQRILSEDKTHYPDVGETFSLRKVRRLPEPLLRRERDVWMHADIIYCASTFTARSLMAAGCEESRCRVIPYGIDMQSKPLDLQVADFFQAIFVGSGGQRKGLHHLLLAWKNANLPAGSRLILVCRVLDDGIKRLLAGVKGVELKNGVSQSELFRLYAASSLFVMPSLVEGFGQVYLEALSQGCPVLGTPHTCLPDLGNEENGIFIVQPSNIDELTAKLETLARSLPGNNALRSEAFRCASRFPWRAFREKLRSILP